MYLNYRHILWVFVLLLIPIAVFSQASRYHYIPPLTSAEGNADDMSNQWIYITTSSTSSVNYTIWELPLNNLTKVTGTISKLSPGQALVNNTDRKLLDNSGFGQLFILSLIHI